MFLIIALLSLFKAHSFTLGFDQTFGSDGYIGTRVPALLLKPVINEKENRRLFIELEMGSYWDSLVNTRFTSIEPKIKVASESEASVQASFRYVFPTDSFSAQDFGIEIHYTLLQPTHDKEPSRLVEELDLVGEIRRRSYSDGIFASRAARTTSLGISEVYVSTGVRLLHNQWGTPKPIIEAFLTKSFYSDNLFATDRANPMANLKGINPFLSVYQDWLLNISARWMLGRPGGFLLQPKFGLTFFSSAGSGSGGMCFGPSLEAGTEDFGVAARVDFVSQAGNLRNFLGLGFYVSI